MSRFPPIDPALTLKRPRPRTGDPYRDIGRRCKWFLDIWDYVNEPDRFENSWGYTIFRTDYSSDERFAKAVRFLTIYAENWLFHDLWLPEDWRQLNLTPRDPRVVYEVRSRLYNVVVEDRTTLDNATIEAVGQQFDLWSARILEEAQHGGRPPTRCMYCILLDKESIDNLLTLPEQPSQVQVPDIYYIWVKVISNETRNGRRLWLRVGVYDVLWEHWMCVSDQEMYAICQDMVAGYDGEGISNLYGPPRPLYSRPDCMYRRPDDYVYSPPRDERPGHPARTLRDVPYERLEP